MVRGTGKYKQKRGGGRSFSKHMRFDKDQKDVDPLRENRDDEDEDEEDEDQDGDDDDSEEDEEDEEEEEEKSELTRAQRKELKKQAAEKQKQGEEEEEDPDLINPNHVQKKLTISDLNEPRQLTRREKEQKEKAEAKDKYWKESHCLTNLHVQGKTQEAKTDLARLAKIRAEREAAQAKRQAEAEAKAVEIEAKKQAQLTKRK